MKDKSLEIISCENSYFCTNRYRECRGRRLVVIPRIHTQTFGIYNISRIYSVTLGLIKFIFDIFIFYLLSTFPPFLSRLLYRRSTFDLRDSVAFQL